MYDIQKIRGDFPILQREVYGRPLVYLDNAATTQKPLCVLDAMREEYLNVNANVHRGVHYLSQQATDLHEAARETVRRFINARKTEEIVFTRGTTEAINLVAATFCESMMQPGDEVLVTDMEHHSNIVPWQLQAERRGIVVRHIPITDDGHLDLSPGTSGISGTSGTSGIPGIPGISGISGISGTSGTSAPTANSLSSFLTPRTRLVSIAHVSNVLGTVNPVADIVRMAHERGIPVLVDAAQSAPHQTIDVQALDCDFLAFSGHKMYGPTGIGVLYGKEEWLDRLPPYQGGGEMIDKVSWERTTFERLPFKFEAGTPDYIATHGLATAIDYVTAIGLDAIAAHEHDLTVYCLQQLLTIPDIHLYGPGALAVPADPSAGAALSSADPSAGAALSPADPSAGAALSPADPSAGAALRVVSGFAAEKDPVLSFNIGSIHHLDIGTLLDRLGIAVRTGHHCAQPLMDRLGISGTVRASFALYNTREEVDVFVAALRRVVQMLT